MVRDPERRSYKVTVVRALLAVAAVIPLAEGVAQPPRQVLPIKFSNSAEYSWLQKPVLASRALGDLSAPGAWALTGTGTLTFPPQPPLGDMKVLRVDVQTFIDKPAPTRNRLSAINLRR